MKHSLTITLACVLAVGVAASAIAQSPEQVRAAQQKLIAVGLYHGPLDGLMDPDTGAAIARFQQQNGLRRTDTLDEQTYARLMSIPSATTAYGSSGPAAAITTRPPSASSHAAAPGSAADNANRPGGASAWQPPIVAVTKNGPGGASTWQPQMVTKTKNSPGG